MDKLIKWTNNYSLGKFLFVLFGIVCLFGGTSERNVLAKTDEEDVLLPKKVRVLIDPGHGGIDRGASSKNGIFESHINLEISKLLKVKLEGMDFVVEMTRNGDYGLYGDTKRGFKRRDMAKRREIAGEFKPDIVLSIHLNISKDKERQGVVSYFSSENISAHVAKSISKAFKKEGLRANEKEEKFFMTHKLGFPCVIVECGFLSSPEEAEKLTTREHQEFLADSIAKGLILSLVRGED